MYCFSYLSQNTFLKCPPATVMNRAQLSEVELQQQYSNHATQPPSSSAEVGSFQTPFAIAGIPWDCSVTGRPGARFGPDAIRRASHSLCDGIHPLFNTSPSNLVSIKLQKDGDEEPHTHNDRLAVKPSATIPKQQPCVAMLSDYGDLELPNTSLEQMRRVMQPTVRKLLSQSKNMVWLGGDHSVTLPLLRAYHAELCPSIAPTLAVVHFDAHCDTWTDHFGEPSGHGTWVSEAITEQLVDPQLFFQIGIRSSADMDARDFVKTKGGMIFDARSLRGKDGADGLQFLVERIALTLEKVSKEKYNGKVIPVYLTFDIDCLDPAFAPGTGTPEPGGLTSTQALTILEELILKKIPFVGMDVVEVAPPYDHSDLTSTVAAHLVWTYLCGMLWQKHQC